MNDQGEKPSIMKVNPSGIPESLKAWAQWVDWRLVFKDGKWKKVPVNSKTGRYASATNPSSWGTFDRIWEHYESRKGREIDGVGFMFTLADPFAGIDLDHCRNAETGEIKPWALEIVQSLNSYTELSPSGSGLHIFVRGFLPPGLRKKDDLEMYDDGRYFTVTGHLLDGASHAIESRQITLRLIHARFLGGGQGGPSSPRPDSSGRQQKARPTTRSWEALVQELSHAELTPPDLEIIRGLKAGRYGELYRLLFMGEVVGAGCVREKGPYRSPSQADQAILNRLARLTNGSRTRMWAIFMETGLVRDKDRDHPTYLARTIQTAIDGMGWQPAQASPAVEGQR